MLCKEYNPVPSPGDTYNTFNGMCNTVAGALWSLIGPIIAPGKSASDYCDQTIRQILSIPPTPEPTCKTPNMGSDKIYTRPNGQRISTNEGRAVVEETIAYLKAKKPVRALEWNLDMWKACREIAEEQAPTGATGHNSADGSTPFVRMARYGRLVSPAGENLAWGSVDGKDAVI